MRRRLGLGALVCLVLAGLAVPAHGTDPVITFRCCAYSQTVTRIAPGGSVTIQPEAGGVTFADHPLVFVDGIGDKATEDTVPVTRTFAAPGNYEFYCSIHGDVNPTTHHVEGMSGVITVTNDQPPVAKLTVGAVAAGKPVALNAGASTDDHGITAYRWDFNNDGKVDETDTKPTTTHTFKTSATVKLTVVDDNAAAEPAVGDQSTSVTAKVTIPAPKVTLAHHALHLADLRAGHAKVLFTASVPGRASATLKAGSTTIATGKATYAKAGHESLTLKLTSAGKAKLRHAKKLSLKGSLTVQDAGGSHATVSLAFANVR